MKTTAALIVALGLVLAGVGHGISTNVFPRFDFFVSQEPDNPWMVAVLDRWTGEVGYCLSGKWGGCGRMLANGTASQLKGFGSISNAARERGFADILAGVEE